MFLLSCLLVTTVTAQEQHKLKASDPDKSDLFGYAVAVHDNHALIGAYSKDRLPKGNVGAAYLFDVTTGKQKFKLMPEDASGGDRFGNAVAINDRYAVVSSPGDYDKTRGNNGGSVYVFDVNTGQQLHKLFPDDQHKYYQFGAAIAVSGDIAIICSRLDRYAQPRIPAFVYLFNVKTGKQLRLLEPENDPGDFGYAVDISGDVAIVSSLNSYAYLFDVNTGKQIRKIAPEDTNKLWMFGWSAAIEGDTAIVGSLDGKIGSAYVFDAKSGRQKFVLTPKNAEGHHRFGYTVDLSGQTAVIGAVGDESGGPDDVGAGAAYLFDITTGQLIREMRPKTIPNENGFGIAVAIHKNTALVGAATDDKVIKDSGAAFLFQVNPTND